MAKRKRKKNKGGKVKVNSWDLTLPQLNFEIINILSGDIVGSYQIGGTNFAVLLEQLMNEERLSGDYMDALYENINILLRSPSSLIISDTREIQELLGGIREYTLWHLNPWLEPHNGGAKLVDKFDVNKLHKQVQVSLESANEIIPILIEYLKGENHLLIFSDLLKTESVL